MRKQRKIRFPLLFSYKENVNLQRKSPETEAWVVFRDHRQQIPPPLNQVPLNLGSHGMIQVVDIQLLANPSWHLNNMESLGLLPATTKKAQQFYERFPGK